MLLALISGKRGAAPPELSTEYGSFCYRDAAPPELSDGMLILSALEAMIFGRCF